MSVNTLCFEDRAEIFRHGIVIRIYRIVLVKTIHIGYNKKAISNAKGEAHTIYRCESLQNLPRVVKA